jgi:ankyrin repeat protein
LSENKTIEEIYLDKNSITEKGGKAMAEDLLLNTTLKILSLNDNLITNDGIRALCKLVSTKDKKGNKIDLSLARNKFVFPNPEDVVGNEDNNLEINLFLAVENKNYVEVLLLCLDGADPNVQNETDGGTPLHISALRNDIKMLEFLVEHPRIDMDTPDDNNLT